MKDSVNSRTDAIAGLIAINDVTTLGTSAMSATLTTPVALKPIVTASIQVKMSDGWHGFFGST